MYAHEIMRRGGKWLGRLRSRVQTMCICGNGETVIWGSNEELRPAPTMAQVEEIGAYAVCGYHDEIVEPLIERWRYIILEASNNPDMTLEDYLRSASGKAVARAIARAIGVQSPLQLEDGKTKFVLSDTTAETIGR